LVLEVDRLVLPGRNAAISFRVAGGEVVGLAGLAGSGRSLLAKVLAGILRPVAGSWKVRGKRVPAGSVADAMSMGLVALPEDRAHGIIGRDRVRDNITLAVLRKMYTRSPLGIRQHRLEASLVRTSLQNVGLSPALAEVNAESLSGGMQQRVLLARSLACDAVVYVLDEPTQGVDLTTKNALHHLVRNTAAGGNAVILISSELEELVAVCDRVLCIRDGQLVGELSGASLTPQRLLAKLFAREVA
jgi:ABC-type sugar transport system ATPase subunit